MRLSSLRLCRGWRRARARATNALLALRSFRTCKRSSAAARPRIAAAGRGYYTALFAVIGATGVTAAVSGAKRRAFVMSEKRLVVLSSPRFQERGKKERCLSATVWAEIDCLSVRA
jgi:hypothetical protein